MNFQMRIPQLGAKGSTGAQIIEKTNVPPSPEDGNPGDLAVEFHDNGDTFLHPKKTVGGWTGTPRQLKGTPGVAGAAGYRGWSAILAPEIFNDDLVFKMVDWVGGQGTKPAVNKYLGASGLVDEPGDAVAYGLSSTAMGTAFDNSGLVGTPDTNVQTALERLFSRPAEFSDFIINGDFGIWQRGAGPFTANGYTADRWRMTFVGGAMSTSRQDFAPGTKIGSVNPRHFLRAAVSGQSTSGHLAIIHQYIEDVRSYAGETVTLLGWMKREAGAGNAVVEGVQSFGTGGSPSSIVTFTALGGAEFGAIEIGSGWAPFAISFEVPSITSKTLGSNANSYLAFNIWLSAGSNFNARTDSLGPQTITADLWGVHIRKGVVPVSAANFYTPRALGVEEILCNRYYQVLAGIAALDGEAPPAAVAANRFLLPTRMRAVPAISVGVGSGSGASFIVYDQRVLAQQATNTLEAQATVTLDAEL
ncbi:MAG: hypothetical protein MEQ84_07905 [Mesorhizobium sp.]|nr:hypothetical protein [Mesorhizobium sp.]